MKSAVNLFIRDMENSTRESVCLNIPHVKYAQPWFRISDLVKAGIIGLYLN